MALSSGNYFRKITQTNKQASKQKNKQHNHQQHYHHHQQQSHGNSLYYFKAAVVTNFFLCICLSACECVPASLYDDVLANKRNQNTNHLAFESSVPSGLQVKSKAISKYLGVWERMRMGSGVGVGMGV